MRLSVVMASMNESKAIRGMIQGIKSVTADDTEIILVDSSTDDTAVIAKEAGAQVIIQPPQGHGAALKTGFLAATGDIVLTMDCDLTYPIEQIPTFVKLIEEDNYDLISGCRMTEALKKEMPFINKIANNFFALMVRILYKIETHDVTTGMFAMKRTLAKTAWVGNRSLPAEMIIRTHLLKKKYLEIPIAYTLRTGETTLSRWRSGKSYLRCFLHWKWGWFARGEL